MENIAGYVFDHTTRDEALWRSLPAGERGPFLVSPRHTPCRDAFLRLVRLQSEKDLGCDPLDGHEHDFDEIARWIGIRGLAVRFIGLGVLLGLFELTAPRSSGSGVGVGGSWCGVEAPEAWRFRLKGARPSRKAPAVSGEVAEPARASRRLGPRRPRYVRCRRLPSGGFYACDRAR